MISLITLDDLGQAIEDEIESYVEGIIPKLEKRLNDTAEDILNYMKRNAPRSGYKNAFADSFVATSNGSGMNNLYLFTLKVKVDSHIYLSLAIHTEVESMLDQDLL